jgi:hypothetical protein
LSDEIIILTFSNPVASINGTSNIRRITTLSSFLST